MVNFTKFRAVLFSDLKLINIQYATYNNFEKDGLKSAKSVLHKFKNSKLINTGTCTILKVFLYDQSEGSK